MRIKSSDGPIYLNNANNSQHDLLNSPKRLNTIHNSRVTSTARPSSFPLQLNKIISTINQTDNFTDNISIINHKTTNDTENDDQGNANATLTEVLDQHILQWYSNQPKIIKEERSNNINNLHHHQNQNQLNINKNILESSPGSDFVTPSSTSSESPDDYSFQEYEEHQHYTPSPAEDRNLKQKEIEEDEEEEDISASETFSESNLGNQTDIKIQEGGIINPNYPGFQHLATDFDFCTKTFSDNYLDGDLDDEYKTKPTSKKSPNNNNDYKNESATEGTKLNFLDKNETKQTKAYNKKVFNIPPEEESLKKFEDLLTKSDVNQFFNQNQYFKYDFSKSDESTPKQPSRSSLIRSETFTLNKELTFVENKPKIENLPDSLTEFSSLIHESFPFLDKSNKIPNNTDIELHKAAQKLSLTENLQPSATACPIQPNIDEPFTKEKHRPRSESPSEMATMSLIRQPDNKNLSRETVCKPKDGTLKRNTMEFIPNKISLSDSYKTKLTDAFLSGTGDKIQDIPDFNNFLPDYNANNNETLMEVDIPWIKKGLDLRCGSDTFFRHEIVHNDKELFHLGTAGSKEMKFSNDLFDKLQQSEEELVVPRKKEKVEMTKKVKRDHNQQFSSLITISKRDSPVKTRDNFNRRFTPISRERKKNSTEPLGNFDVYNIETAMPTIDLEAIECHLKAAREEERKRRTDREEIRRRLAMGAEDDYFSDRPGKKPSLQSRLQSGMNLQICFMNESVSDTESPSSDIENPITNIKNSKRSPRLKKSPSLVSDNSQSSERPATLPISECQVLSASSLQESQTEGDFFTKQAKLQTEARMALAQAKEMARMQMELERQHQVKSPITEMVRNSLEKVGIPFPEEKRRLSRQILTEMNIAQLQVIVNDLHTQIETLNDKLVKFLMERDDLHMEQDSMLVDIEDLTRYLGAKEISLKGQNNLANECRRDASPPSPAPPSPPRSPLTALNSVKPHLHRIANLVKK